MKRFAGLILGTLLMMGAGPASRPSGEIATWFVQLADKQQSIRSAARDHLMGLSRDDLPELLEVVKQARPLLPTQSLALREIVQQAYLSGEPYDKQHAGFLGVSLLDTTIKVDGAPRKGVLVFSRWPGFAGFRYLMDGDIIVGVDEFGPAAPDQLQFVTLVKATEPGTVLTFRVIRQAQVVPIRIPVGSRPAYEDGLIENMLTNWVKKEAQFWQKNFAELVDDASGGAGMAGE